MTEDCPEEIYAEVLRMRNAAWKAKLHLERELEAEPLEAVRAILASVRAYTAATEMLDDVSHRTAEAYGETVGKIVHLSSVAAAAGLLETAVEIMDKTIMEQD